MPSLSAEQGETFDGTHSIEHWARRASLIQGGNLEKQDELRVALDELNMRWRARTGTIQVAVGNNNEP